MQNSADDYATSALLIEDNVFADLKATKTRNERIARTPHAWILSNQVKAIRQKAEITFRLRLTPGVCCVQKNFDEIGSCLQG